MAAPLCLAALGIDMRPLLAVGSVGTLAVGFAAQSTISNFVSAMAIVSSGRRVMHVSRRVPHVVVRSAVIVSGGRWVMHVSSKVPQVVVMSTVVPAGQQRSALANRNLRN